MANDVLVDSDFFIALYSLSDTNHIRAVAILESLSKKTALQMFVSALVYSETATVLSQRVSQKTAHHFMDDIKRQGGILIHSDEALFSAAGAFFQKQRSKNVSFVDVVNMVLMDTYTFSALLSFDRDYIKNGIKLMNS